MRIAIAGELVFSVAVGRQVEMMTEEGSTIQIEGRFEVRPARLSVEPGAPPSDGERALLEVLYSRIVDCVVEGSVLTVAFSNGVSLVVPHLEGFEAWNINMPGRSPNLVVMGPAGEMMIFGTAEG